MKQVQKLNSMPCSPKTQMLVDLSCIDKSIGGKTNNKGRSMSKDSV